MSLTEKVTLIIYRLREKGLEIFLVNADKETDQWELPKGEVVPAEDEEHVIPLDPVPHKDGAEEKSIAVESDYHEIPSLKALLKEDVLLVKDQIEKVLPEVLESGAFFGLKEAFKRVLPHQYKQLKELKEILTDRNSTKYL